MSQLAGRRVLILTHLVPEVTDKALVRALAVLSQHEAVAVVPASEAEKHQGVLAGGGRYEEWPDETVPDRMLEVSMCLVLGGDGTTLRALRATRGVVPVAAINLGRVGFLSTIPPASLERDLTRVLEGEAVVHALPALTLAGPDELWAAAEAFNDICFTRLPQHTMCRLAYSLNGVDLYDLRCDGLVAATAVGSSAYNLSVGGPLLGLGLGGYVVSYVAPHALNARAIVAPGTDVLRVRNTSVREAVAVVVDGESRGALPPGGAVSVGLRPNAAGLALLPQDGLYRNFRDRFL